MNFEAPNIANVSEHIFQSREKKNGYMHKKEIFLGPSFLYFILIFLRRSMVELESLNEINQWANKWQPCVWSSAGLQMSLFSSSSTDAISVSMDNSPSIQLCFPKTRQ